MSAEAVTAHRLRARHHQDSRDSCKGTAEHAASLDYPLCAICHGKLVSQPMAGGAYSSWHHETPTPGHEAVPLDISEMMSKARFHDWMAEDHLVMANLLQGYPAERGGVETEPDPAAVPASPVPELG